MLGISRTLPFRSFQRTVGNITFHINTAYVALELVARGAQKPADLMIKWSPPKNPRDAVAQSRALLHSAMLAYVFSAIDTYLRRIADDKWLNVDNGTRQILRKSLTKPGGIAFSVAERFAALGNQFSGNQRADEILVEVLCAWRNQSTHEDGNVSSVRIRISAEIQEELAGFGEQLAKRYGDLSILEMLDHMQKNHAPSRKDIVALVSASQNFVRAIDEALLKKTFEGYGSLERYAFDVLAGALKDNRQLRTLWGKDVKTRTRRLKAILEEAGFSPADAPQLRLPADFIQEVARLNFAGISEKLS